MKKLFLGVFVAAFTLSVYSCRETTEENVEADVEEVEADLEETGEDIEATGEEMEEEVQTDDVQ